MKYIKRPKVRGDCVNGIRPCPWVGCKYHLLWDAKPVRDRDNSRFWNNDQYVSYLLKMENTCVLDMVEDERECTLQEIANVYGVCRERARQYVAGKATSGEGGLLMKLRKRNIQEDWFERDAV